MDVNKRRLLCGHDIMPITGDVQSTAQTCLCPYGYRDSSKVNLWVFKYKADMHKKMKRIAPKGRPGSGQWDEQTGQ